MEILETEKSLKQCGESLSHLQGQSKTLLARQNTVTLEVQEMEENDCWLKKIADISFKKNELHEELEEKIAELQQNFYFSDIGMTYDNKYMWFMCMNWPARIRFLAVPISSLMALAAVSSAPRKM